MAQTPTDPSTSPVLLHGFTGSGAAWGSVLIDALASAVTPPVLLDLPGHGRWAGRTDPAHFTLASVFDLIEGAGAPASEGAGPQGRLDLVGYSMGGRLALAYAVNHPGRVRRLVLESASPGLETETARAERRASDQVLAAGLEAGGIGTFVDAWEALPLFATQASLAPAVRARVRAGRLANDPASLAAALRGLGTGALPSYWAALGALGIPVLLIAGAEDAKFVEIGRRMAERLPDARLVVVEGAGHAVHLERPDAWLDLVSTFLSAPRPPR